jgi:hypothetical protein
MTKSSGDGDLMARADAVVATAAALRSAAAEWPSSVATSSGGGAPYWRKCGI